MFLRVGSLKERESSHFCSYYAFKSFKKEYAGICMCCVVVPLCKGTAL